MWSIFSCPLAWSFFFNLSCFRFSTPLMFLSKSNSQQNGWHWYIPRRYLCVSSAESHPCLSCLVALVHPCSMAQDRAGCALKPLQNYVRPQKAQENWPRRGKRSGTARHSYFLGVLLYHLSASWILPTLPKVIIIIPGNVLTFSSTLTFAIMSFDLPGNPVKVMGVFCFQCYYYTNGNSQTRSRAGTRGRGLPTTQ